MIKTDKKGNVIACITTKEDLDYTNFDKETIKYYEDFLIPSYEELSDKQNKEIERLNNIINEFNKLIENEINESKLEEDYDRVDAMEYCLATLRELKGSDKE